MTWLSIFIRICCSFALVLLPARSHASWADSKMWRLPVRMCRHSLFYVSCSFNRTAESCQCQFTSHLFWKIWLLKHLTSYHTSTQAIKRLIATIISEERCSISLIFSSAHSKCINVTAGGTSISQSTHWSMHIYLSLCNVHSAKISWGFKQLSESVRLQSAGKKKKKSLITRVLNSKTGTHWRMLLKSNQRQTSKFQNKIDASRGLVGSRILHLTKL